MQQGHNIGRRAFVLGSAAAAVTATAQPRLVMAAVNDVIYGARGGVLDDIFRKSVLEPMAKDTGLNIVSVPYPEMAKLKAMVETNSVDLDVWEIDSKAMQLMAQQGLLEPIDYSLLPSFNEADFVASSKQEYGVGEVVFGAGIIYNSTTHADAHPTTWAEFWDVEEFPGPRTLPDLSYLIGPIEPALLADGVPPDQLYPIDVDRAFKSLSRIKPHIVKFWTKAAEGLNLMTSGEADLGMLTYGRVVALRQQEPSTPLNMEYNQGIATLSYWVIPKGAPNVKNAHRFIEYFCQADHHAAFINAYPAYGPANKKASPLILPENEPVVITSSVNEPKVVVVKSDWWVEQDASGKSNYDKVMERWTDWISG